MTDTASPSGHGPNDRQPTSFVKFVDEQFGPSVALDIQAHFGGAMLYIPRHPQPRHKLCRVIGVERVATIVGLFGDGVVEISLGQTGAAAIRRARMARLCPAGRSASQVARELGCTTRAVFKARARLRGEGRLA